MQSYGKQSENESEYTKIHVFTVDLPSNYHDH